MKTYPIIDRSKNRQITDADVAHCQRNIDALFAFASLELTQAEVTWWNTSQSCHDRVFKESARTVSREFLSTLRTRTQCFTGHNIAVGRENELCWFDQFAPSSDGFTDWCIPLYEKYSKIKYRCRPPLVAGETGYDVGGICINRDVAASQERVFILNALEVFDDLAKIKRPVIVEIGAGFGSLAYYLTTFLPNAAYVIIDLHASLIYSICYLTLAAKGKQLRVCASPPDSFEPGTITYLGPESISDPWNTKIDLAINTLSFAEMPPATVEGYARFLAEHLGGYLFEQNFRFPHHPPEHYSDPKPVLGNIFSHQLPYFGNYETVYGEACLWGTKPFDKPRQEKALADAIREGKTREIVLRPG